MQPADKPRRRRRQPKQARSRATVDAIVEAAARVFRREGWGATTNRIAVEAGVSVGSLYEYFPDKQALLVALAERHVALAEREVATALEHACDGDDLLARLQRAVIESQRFPSHALTLVEDETRAGPALRERARRLRARALVALAEHVRRRNPQDAELRARAAFAVACELTARALFEEPDDARALARHYLKMAQACLR